MPPMFLPVAMASSATVIVDESGRAQCHRRLPAARVISGPQDEHALIHRDQRVAWRR
jgi:hypothetical protein